MKFKKGTRYEGRLVHDIIVENPSYVAWACRFKEIKKEVLNKELTHFKLHFGDWLDKNPSKRDNYQEIIDIIWPDKAFSSIEVPPHIQTWEKLDNLLSKVDTIISGVKYNEERDTSGKVLYYLDGSLKEKLTKTQINDLLVSLYTEEPNEVLNSKGYYINKQELVGDKFYIYITG